MPTQNKSIYFEFHSLCLGGGENSTGKIAFRRKEEQSKNTAVCFYSELFPKRLVYDDSLGLDVEKNGHILFLYRGHGILKKYSGLRLFSSRQNRQHFYNTGSI